MHVSNILGTVNPVADDRPRARTRSARWSWSTPRRRCRTCPVDVAALGADFVRLHRAQDVRPDRHRRALGPARAARRAAAVPRRRRDDRDGRDDRLDVRAVAAQVRGGHAADRAGGRSRRGGRLPDRARAWTRSPRTSRRSPRTRWSGCATVAGPADHRPGHRRSTAAARSRFTARRASTRTTWARCSTSRASRCGSATTARAGLRAVRNSGDHPGVVLPVHDAGRDRRPGRRSGHEVSEGVRGAHETRLDVPGDHPGPLQAPAPAGPAGAVRRRGAPREPDLRRRGHPAGARSPTAAWIEDVSYEAPGCSISQAVRLRADRPAWSASRSTDAVAVQEEFLRLMQSKGTVEPDEEVLEDAVAFAGVSKYPARVKCALLGWMAWKDATAQALSPSDARGARRHDATATTPDRRGRRGGHARRGRPRTRHQRGRPRPGLRRARRRATASSPST